MERPDGRAFKLSSNESPFGPLPSVVEAIAEAAADVNRYPDNGARRADRGDRASASASRPSTSRSGCGSVGVAQQLLAGGRRARATR